MIYFVKYLQTYAPTNRACNAAVDAVVQYKQVLINGQEALDTLVNEIKKKVEKISDAYPKLKPLNFSSTPIGDGIHICVYMERQMCNSGEVFTMDICQVNGIYLPTGMLVPMPEEGGEL
jgi:hypothetical protein